MIFYTIVRNEHDTVRTVLSEENALRSLEELRSKNPGKKFYIKKLELAPLSEESQR